MLTLDQIRQIMQDRNKAQVCRNAGIHPNTMQRLLDRNTVRYEVVEKLSRYLEGTMPGNKADQ